MDTKIIDQALDKYLPCGGKLAEAMRYSALAPGKKFRPKLVLAACEAVGGKAEKALPVACAIEFVHVYSLIHDDLPAMDDDDYRRGQPASHKKFGEAVAILAGDALSTLAFEVIASDVPSDKVAAITVELTQALGIRGMVGGQIDDLESEGKEINLEMMRSIHVRKTGALIRAAVRGGAIIGGATFDELKSLTLYAEHLGVAFQIMDDIKDVEGSLETTGKTPGSDKRKKKATYPSLVGVEESRKIADKEVTLALEALKSFDQKAETLREIIKPCVRL